MSQSKELRDLIRELERQGFTVEPLHSRKSSRCRVTSPDGRVVVMPGPATRAERRALLNARAALRRIGADV